MRPSPLQRSYMRHPSWVPPKGRICRAHMGAPGRDWRHSRANHLEANDHRQIQIQLQAPHPSTPFKLPNPLAELPLAPSPSCLPLSLRRRRRRRRRHGQSSTRSLEVPLAGARCPDPSIPLPSVCFLDRRVPIPDL